MTGEKIVTAAEVAMAEADQKIDNATKEAAKDPKDKKDDPHEFEISVIYNGVEKAFEVRRDELTLRLLEQARQAFGQIDNAHLLSLFDKNGVELKDDQTIKQAHVKPRDVLLLRPSSVRGG